MKIDGLWIDYVIMGLIQIYFIIFNCHLFSWEYKFHKGQALTEMFEKYCQLTSKTS